MESSSTSDHWLMSLNNTVIYIMVASIIIATIIILMIISCLKYKRTASINTDLTAQPQQVSKVKSISLDRIDAAAPEDLPDGWTSAMDVNGRTFYQNHTTKAAQWDKPSIIPLPQAAPSVPSDQAPRPMQQQHVITQNPAQTQQIQVPQQHVQPVQPKRTLSTFCDVIFALIMFVLSIPDHSTTLILAKEWLGGVQCALYDEPLDLGLGPNAQVLVYLVFLNLIIGACDIYWNIEQVIINKTCLFDNRVNHHNSFFLSVLGAVMLIFGDIVIMSIQVGAGFTTGTRTAAWQQSFYLSAVMIAIVSVKGMYDVRQLSKPPHRYKCISLPFTLNCLACCPINCCLVFVVLVFGAGTMLGSAGVIVINDVALQSAFGVEVDRVDWEIGNKTFDFNCTQHSTFVTGQSGTKKSREVSCEFLCTESCDDGAAVCSEVNIGGYSAGGRVQENECESTQCGSTNIEVCYTVCDGNE